MREADLRRSILRVALTMDAAGFAPSKSGNVSARTQRGFLITPSALPYARTKAADLVHVDADGAVLAGRLPPSSEWRFHAAIYAARPDVNAVVHTHSPRATALSCLRLPIPAFHYMVAMAGGDHIACARYATFGTAELARTAVAGLGPRNAVLLANHGIIAAAGDLDKAWAIAFEVENLAGQYLDLLASGRKPVILGAAEMRRVREAFKGYGR